MRTSSLTTSKIKKEVIFFRKFSLLSPFYVKNPMLVIAYFLCQLLYLLAVIAPIISLYSQHWYFKLLKMITQLVFYTPSNSFQKYFPPIVLISLVCSLIVFLNFYQQSKSSQPLKHGLTFYNYSLFGMVLLSNTLSNLFISTMLIQAFSIHTVLAVLAVSVLLLTIYLLLQLSNEIQYKQFSRLSRIFQEREGIFYVLKTISACLVNNLSSQYQKITTFLIFFVLLLNFLDLKTALFRSKYLDSTTETIYQIKVFLEALCLTTYIFVYLLGKEIPEMVQNIFALQIVVFLFSYYGFKVFKEYRYKSLIQDRNILIDNEDEAIQYMLSLTRIASDEGFERQYLLKLNLIEAHCRKCQNIQCLCFTIEQKNKISTLISNKKFIQKVIYDRFTQVRPQFSQSFIVLIIYISYKLSFLSLFSKIQHDLRDFTTKTKLNFSQRYIIFQLSNRVEKQVQQITISSKTIEMEKIFTEQFMDRSIQNTIQELCTLFIRKYTLLEVQNPSYIHIQQICYDLSSKIRQMELLLHKFRESNSYNLRIYEKCLFYADKIIDNNVQAKSLRREMLLKLKLLHTLKGIKKHNMDKYLYTKKACVIQSNLQIPIGTIRNVSNSCFQFFGHEKSKIMDKDIHYIMPPFLIPGHKQRVLKWLSNESFTSNLVGLLDFFFIKPDGVCFNGKIHLKLATNGYILILYVYLAKEDEDNYVVVSKQNITQGIGKKLINQMLYQFGNIGKHFADFNLQQKMKNRYQYKCRFQKNNYFKIENKMVQFVNAAQKDDQDISMITYDCEILIKKHYLGSLFYFSIKFLDINKIFKNEDNLSFKSVHILKQYPIINYKQVVDRQTDKHKVLKEKQVESIITLENEDRDKYQNLLEKNASSSINGDKVSLSSLSIRDKIRESFLSQQNKANTFNLGYIYIFFSFTLLGAIIILSPQIYQGHRAQILDFLSRRSSIIQQVQQLELQAMNSIVINTICYENPKHNSSCAYIDDYLNKNPYKHIVQGVADYYTAIENYSIGAFKNIYNSLVGFSLLPKPKKTISLQIGDVYQHSVVQMKLNFQQHEYQTEKNQIVISQIFKNRNNLNDWKKDILIAFSQLSRQSLSNSTLIRMLIGLSVILATITMLFLAIRQKLSYINGVQSVLQLNLFMKKETSLKFKMYFEKIRKIASASEYNQIDEEQPNVDYIFIGRGKRAKFEFRSCFTFSMICSYIILVGLYAWTEILLQKDGNFLDDSLLNSFQLQSKEDWLIQMFYSFQEAYFYDISKLNQTIQSLQKSNLSFIQNIKDTITQHSSQAQINFLVESIPQLLKSKAYIDQKQYQYSLLPHIRPLMDNGIITTLTYLQKWTLENSLKLKDSNSSISKAQIIQIHQILSFILEFFKVLNFSLFDETIRQNSINYGPSYAGFASSIVISLMLMGYYWKQTGEKSLLYGIVYQLPTSLVLNRYSFSIIKSNIQLDEEF